MKDEKPKSKQIPQDQRKTKAMTNHCGNCQRGEQGEFKRSTKGG